jgi:uncharacterized membrane protein (UPF0127 family)
LRSRIAAACLIVFALFLPPVAEAAGTGTLVLKTDSGEHSYTVEVADTDRERAKGLMFRRSLPKKSGMIFLYDPPQPVGMWMRNTYIPLDMVFITAKGTVRRVETNTQPFTTDIILSGGPVAAVLELNAGEAAEIGLKPGDRVVFPGLGTTP